MSVCLLKTFPCQRLCSGQVFYEDQTEWIDYLMEFPNVNAIWMAKSRAKSLLVSLLKKPLLTYMQVKQPWVPPRFPVWPLPSCPGQWATPGLGTKSLVRQWHLPSEGWWVMWAPWLAYLKHDEDEENLSRSLSWRTIRYMWHGCIR